MKVSRKAVYGFRALARLSALPGGCGMSVHTLAQEECLPEEYLEKILQHLKRDGFVVSEKGARGGYALAKDPEAITSWDIIESLDGGFRETPHPAFPGFSTHSPECPILTHCQTKNVWEQLEDIVRKTLSKITLADLGKQ